MKMPFFSSPNMPVSIKAIRLSGTAALLTTGVAAGLGVGVAPGLGAGVAAGFGVGVAAGLGVGVAPGFGVVVSGLVWAMTEIPIMPINIRAAKIKRFLFMSFLPDSAHGLSPQITQNSRKSGAVPK